MLQIGFGVEFPSCRNRSIRAFACMSKVHRGHSRLGSVWWCARGELALAAYNSMLGACLESDSSCAPIGCRQPMQEQQVPRARKER